MVVIATIGILAVLLLPTLANSVQKDNQMQCVSNLKQIGIALALYANDHNGYFPAISTDSTINPSNFISRAWTKEINRYLPLKGNGDHIDKS